MSASETYLTAYFIPVSTILAWPDPVGDQAESRKWYVGWIVTLMVFSTIAVVVRIYAHYRFRTWKIGLDDVFILLAWIFAIFYTVSTSLAVMRGGFDKHVWESLMTGDTASFFAFFTEVIFLASTSLSKLSVLAYQRRILRTASITRYTRAIDCAIAFTVVSWITFSFLLLLSCSPVSAAWRSMSLTYRDSYRCIHRNVSDPLASSFSVASDVYALIIPELIIYKLHLERRTKVVLYVVFGSGLLVVGAGIARTVWVSRLFTDPTRDLTWIGYDTMVWGGVELQLSIVCASAPALKAFISNVKAGRSQLVVHEIRA